MDRILVICGPTAVGKTRLAFALAKQFGGELISADSRQVYKGMDVGTGKDLPDKKIVKTLQCPLTSPERKYILHPYEYNGIPLWLYDIVDPDMSFSVSEYHTVATSVIGYIQSRNKLPIIVGGTGFYIRSILHPPQTIHIPPDMTFRKSISETPLQKLQEMLEKEAPMVWAGLNTSDRGNPRRLIRKLEIFHAEKKVKNHVQVSKDISGNMLCIGLKAKLSHLYEKIDARVNARVREGISAEIETLLKKGYSWDLPSFSSMGYRQWKIWFTDPDDQTRELKNQIIQKWKYDEHAYARRQMTFLRGMDSIEWFDIEDPSYPGGVTARVLTWYTKDTV